MKQGLGQGGMSFPGGTDDGRGAGVVGELRNRFCS